MKLHKTALALIICLLFLQCQRPTSMNSSFRVHTLRLHPGNDVMIALKKFIADNGIEAGFIMSAVGSLTNYTIRFANQENGSKASGHFEVVSLTGLLSTEGNHIHLSVSDSTGRTIGGHLLEGNLVYTKLEVVIGEDLDHSYHRETDATFGYKELVVKEKKE
jgi:predicted DNA-binding protein with PD1-like motif